jgi:DNA-binding GntR family transcriptional regulator
VEAVRLRTSDRAYLEIREHILDLRLPPGSVVNEQSLATDLGLGRMPVREAIARLANDRFVTVFPRRGTIVTPVTLDDVFAMFQAREAIECGVVHIVARRATGADLVELRRLVTAADRAREGTDHEAFLRDDHAIHTRLVHTVCNALLQAPAERLLLHNLRFWRSYWAARPARQHTMMSHDALLTALEARDPQAAQAAMRAHLVASRQLLQDAF